MRQKLRNKLTWLMLEEDLKRIGFKQDGDNPEILTRRTEKEEVLYGFEYTREKSEYYRFVGQIYLGGRQEKNKVI